MNQNIISLAISNVMPTVVASGLMVSVCSISAPTPASGAISGTYTPVTGLQDIQCMNAPEPWGNHVGATEQKTMSQIASMAERHVLLDDYYQLLSPSTNWGNLGWQATVDGVIYDLIGAEADSQQTQTRLCLRKVTT